MTAPPFYIVTGGPGAGKTTLIEALAAAGFATVEEGARRIIRDGIQGTGHDPRLDPGAFLRAMLDHDLMRWHEARDAQGPVFFDRGLPDLLGYCLLEGIEPPGDLLSAVEACRYQPAVFLLPPWPDIYARDPERIQSPQEAEESYLRMREVYPRCGYRLAELPRADIQTRLAFVRSRVKPCASPRAS